MSHPKYMARIAETLERYAVKVRNGDFVNVSLELNQPERELDPMCGECPYDTMRHFVPGDRIALTLVCDTTRIA